ncbi:MAG: hypothetical protein KGL25_07910 [Gammaproteobacteria bacterium]|nr:hypothetical protein [Gammaproteobacteria bacterium]MDE2251316.1 hypothetical protein [Gammaproteobacteria bacterium]
MQTEGGPVALVAGANGMVGAELVRVLVASGEYRRVIALSRRPLPVEAPRLVNRILRFENLEHDLRGLACDDAYCCLGTTLREAGSRQALRAVDHDLVLRFARFAQGAGAKTLVVVSAAGAAPAARIFYLRVKGETELALEALRFRSLHLLQPSLLLGQRRQWRTAEALARVFMPLVNPLLLGRLERWRAISAHDVAAAMRTAARSGRLGVQRYGWRAMRAMAAAAPVRARM